MRKLLNDLIIGPCPIQRAFKQVATRSGFGALCLSLNATRAGLSRTCFLFFSFFFSPFLSSAALVCGRESEQSAAVGAAVCRIDPSADRRSPMD